MSKEKKEITQEQIDQSLADYLDKGGSIKEIPAVPEEQPEKEAGFNYLRTLEYSADSRISKSLNVSQRWVPTKASGKTRPK